MRAPSWVARTWETTPEMRSGWPSGNTLSTTTRSSSCR
jgi:hypothetical protein